MGEALDRFQEREKIIYRKIIADYLKYGSVDEVFKKNDYNIPVSYPGVQRLLDKWGIVKAAGPNSKLSEALTFMVLLSDHKIPLEQLYKKLPPSFKTSMGTMHRILHNVKEGVVRRVGSALVIASEENRDLILVGEDISTPRMELGKPFGSISLPMGYSKQDENPRTSILRILQQEVFSLKAIDKQMPVNVIPENPKPFMYLDVADVRVAVYNLILPEKLCDLSELSSFKIKNHRFIHYSEGYGSKNGHHFRTGIKEICMEYRNYLSGKQEKPFFLRSFINLNLAEPAPEYSSQK